MDGYYDLNIVALSIAVAIIASYTALDMAGRVSASDSSARKSVIWLVAGAMSMGTGIWSMHFIGMLSFHLPIKVAFDLPITLLSLIIAIVASFIALFFLRQAQLGIRNLVIGTILMGSGIAAMHYTGMFAMQMSPPIRYEPLLFVASILIAIVASLAALWISFQLRWKHSRHEILAKVGSAVVMGLAISGMHYTGMAAARFAPGSVCLAVTSGGIDLTTLAFGIGSLSLVIMSFTLIVSTLDANFSKKIEVLARTDGLTGLANSATFIERLHQAFAAAQRGASPFAIISIDLDHFKEVNDTLGHSAGDLLLKSVAGHLKRNCRESDFVARLGGDEFAILQTEVSGVSDAIALASKIHRVLSTPYQLGDGKLFVSVSIGISVYTDEMAGPDEMLAKADIALYRAKEDGRDQYRFHSDDLDQEMRERMTLTGDLRQALEQNELELYYQPQVELFTGRIAGMEALIRWNHPKRGLLMPADFIPIMEKTDAILALGYWVLDHACEQMSSWRTAGIAPMVLAVNLSLGQLRTGDELIQSVTMTLAKWGLTPRDLELDVTESMLAYATWAYNDVLEQLQQLGVTIAIDDFGTQYSSLDYLKHYRVSRVKIPRAMIAAATQQDQESAAMVRAIIGLTRELNIEVMAQGVENEAQRDLLTAAPSTTKVQGFYYSAPVPAVHATELLRQRLIEPRLSQDIREAAAQ
ncbi:EAL domain-containing protein [Methylocapsa sp. D3K7]|uniref:putative bifunctional diguanylate cyclase/phosphodiesterase n=1 Tax=Methylocapsa sp. D3K7 TaxID=3041435 RepID=UPI00244ECA15|nr:EAL domain-containing protein [Methylocapsa sp. D3K7]WGJ16411.1 EAL domain-containing protein [Methylocapsa sp. D3K7]